VTASLKRTLFTLLAGAMAAFLVFSLAGVRVADASHEPANKGAAAGSDIDTVEGEGDGEAILSDTIRVASPEDIIIQVTAECSILTALTTNNDSSNAFAFGSVRLWVELDGTRVPVAVDDTAEDGDDEVEDDGDESDIGEATFCNRAYERTVTDDEDPSDGIDEEDDYIRTRTANAFNWLALDTGVTYDDPANGNNIIEVVLFADFDTSTAGEAAAEAFVGSRTMILEPTSVSIHEQVEPAGGDGS
jgi:hypothetical protein